MVKKAQFLAGGLLPLLCGTFAAAEVFNPREYPKQVATCKAVNRAEGKDVDIELCEHLPYGIRDEIGKRVTSQTMWT